MSTEPNEGQASLSTEELIAAVFAATLPQVIEQVMGENLLWPEQYYPTTNPVRCTTVATFPNKEDHS